MSWFEVNKILASIILALIALFIIAFIGDSLISPKIPKEQAYVIDIPEDFSNTTISTNLKDADSYPEPISELLTNASIENGGKISKKCGSCHTFNKGEPNKVGPNLYEIVGSSVGKIDGFAYSNAMINLTGKWGYEELAKFFYKPKKYIEGTKMNFAGLKKAQDRADLILWLREKSDNPLPLP